MGLPGYEDEVMRRAVEFELEPGKAIQVRSAEDLIIHKAIAGRRTCATWRASPIASATRSM